MSSKFTYPFCYTPSAPIKLAAKRLCAKIDADPQLHEIFSEGKMLGVLQIGDGTFLYAFSGLAGGRADVDGFVPPIYDFTAPHGYFRTQERIISEYRDKAEKSRMSEELQNWLFRQYVVMNARFEKKSIMEIFASRGLVPPGGTGDCAGPKLLQYAYMHKLRPIAMGEFWYGRSPRQEVRQQGAFYPSCTGKCGPLLSFMMEGLEVEPNPLDKVFEFEKEPEIIFEDECIIVVNKPYGMLSVRGKTGKISLEEYLCGLYGREIFSCHRLDMDTAGLIVFAKTIECQTNIRSQFESRTVRKTYRAKLCPSSPGSRKLTQGHKAAICLPLMPDYYDRPRQMVCGEGKKAVTEYEVLDIFPDGTADVRFTPLTGRTHQLRVHAAHIDGLGRPILGDRLYGGNAFELPGTDGHLHLLADSLSFIHPISKKELSFSII